MRDRVQLAFVLPIVKNDTGQDSYVLQFNTHLNSHNFFGGHVKAGETFRDASLREFREETGAEELRERWNVEALGHIDEDEWQAVAKCMVESDDLDSVTVQVPFYSVRAQREDKPPERLAELKLFPVDVSDCPSLIARLEQLSKTPVPSAVANPGETLCRLFTREELLEEAWRNPDNPFLRCAVKNGVIGFVEEDKKFAPYLVNAAAFEQAAETMLTRQDRVARVLRLGAGETIDIRLLPPGDDHAVTCLEANVTLTARLEMRWSGSEHPLRLEIPYPQDGVFVLHSDSSPRGACWNWHPRLLARPGLWPLDSGNDRVLRMGFIGGRYFDIPVVDKSQRKGTPRQRAQKLLDTGAFPRIALVPTTVTEYGGDAHGTVTPGNGALATNIVQGKKQRVDLIESVIQHADSVSSNPGMGWLDVQDIAYQRLFTYASYLLEQLTTVLAARAIGVDETQGGAYWDGLLNNLVQLERDLIPLSELRSRLGWLHLFDPVNGLDALSRLTSFQRYNIGNRNIDKLPPYTRQNHPSMRNLVCPVDSPESGKVGITLHLARGVEVDVTGVLYPAPDEGKDRSLGYAASLVPFYQHNDGARSMMGGKTLKQALPVRGRASPLSSTGHEAGTRERVRPLAETGLFPAVKELAPGVDVLVAYLPWYGMNFEDGIVASRRLVDAAVLDCDWEDHQTRRIAPGYELASEPPAETTMGQAFQQAFRNFAYDDKGLRRRGMDVDPSSVLAWFRNQQSGELMPMRCGGDGAGELVDIQYIAPLTPTHGGLLKWSVRRRRPLEVGDKLTGRHGNKGVVSALLDEDQMPRLPDDEALPATLRGRTVDVILNPHGVISRMNLGQLLETQAGLAAQLGEESISASARAFDSELAARSKAVIEANSNQSEDPVMDRYGRMRLSLPGGGQTARPVVVGYQQFVRLPHFARRKAQARSPRSDRSEQLYSLTTGQPVGGRQRGGGQRIGEMEIWALAAHDANDLLQGILGAKSDPSRIEAGSASGQTFAAIRDHLFALGIQVHEDEAGIRLDWLNPDALSDSGCRVTSGKQWTAELQGTFACRKERCAYRYPRPVFASGQQQRAGLPALTIADVFQEHGFVMPQRIEGILPALENGGSGKDRKVQVEAERIDGTGSGSVSFTCNRKKRSLNVRFEIAGESFAAYRQLKADTDFALSGLGAVPITCPRHGTAHLKAEGENLTPKAVPGGLCDPQIVGGVDPASEVHESARPYIELPFPVPYPRAKGSLVFGRNDYPPELYRIPVLPLRYRYGRPSFNSGDVVPVPDDLTAKYASLFELINAKKPYKAGIESTVRDIFVKIYKRLFGKFGLIRRAGLGRRVDASGRLVIVPEPSLEWDECALPVQVLGALLGPRIAEWEGLREFEDDDTVTRLTEALTGTTLPQVREEVWEHVLRDEYWRAGSGWVHRHQYEELDFARRVIKGFLAEHPETRVVVNRNPSLHRYSMMAFRPVVGDRVDEVVMKINPLVCEGYGADFDGDEMSVHLPLSPSEHEEADRLRPTTESNLLSVADGEPLAGFDQDFVLGHYLISTDTEKKAALEQAVGVPDCRDCATLFQAPAPWDKSHGSRLMAHLCEAHPDEADDAVPAWMREAFSVVTEEGISFGFLELEALAGELSASTAHILENLNGSDRSALAHATAELGDQVGEYLQGVEEAGRQDPAAPGYGFASMAVSGARGENQARQILASRGFLDPGAVGFDPDKQWGRFVGETSLVAGMDPETAFWLAMNTRSSMVDKKLATPTAGAITRRLVLAAWQWQVTTGDCEATAAARRVSQCAWLEQKRVCSVCYGDVPGLDGTPDGYPAGLLAAQSFGERGTQLSMQSFHTGQAQLSVDAVEALLGGRDPNCEGINWFRDGNSVDEFLERIRSEGAYAKLDPRHLELIWTIINRSEKATLDSAVNDNQSALSALAAPGQWRALLNAVRESSVDDLGNPVVRILLGKSPL